MGACHAGDKPKSQLQLPAQPQFQNEETYEVGDVSMDIPQLPDEEKYTKATKTGLPLTEEEKERRRIEEKERMEEEHRIRERQRLEEQQQRLEQQRLEQQRLEQQQKLDIAHNERIHSRNYWDGINYTTTTTTYRPNEIVEDMKYDPTYPTGYIRKPRGGYDENSTSGGYNSTYDEYYLIITIIIIVYIIYLIYSINYEYGSSCSKNNSYYNHRSPDRYYYN